MFRKFSQWFDSPPTDKTSQGKRRSCTYSGCLDEGTYRAPKSRYHLESGVDDWHWFCLVHIRDYNAQWNYYANMSEAQIEKERRADVTWQRPSWPLGAFSEPQARATARGRRGNCEKFFQDPFGLFHEMPSLLHPLSQSGFAPQSPEGKALNTLGLSYPFSPNDLGKKYRFLVKKYHPDANGGSPQAEETIKRINEAYEVLKKVSC
jgi:hypothetical protein